MKKKTTHYVNNEDFLKALVLHKEAIAQAEDQNLSKPRIPEYIGECLLKIATHLSYKNNFSGYSFRDDMVSDGIENCIQYLHNFNPEKSKNPFAYFTQIIYFAFLRRIQKERLQSTIKNEIIQNRPYDTFELHEHDTEGIYQNTYTEYLHQHSDDKPKKEVKPKKNKKKNLEHFMVDEVAV